MPNRLQSYFLPDLCNTRAILILLAVSEAFVLAVTLLESSITEFSWQRFAILSLFSGCVCYRYLLYARYVKSLCICQCGWRLA